MMSSTLRYASENLLMFGLVFAIIFFAFVQFFYLIYSIQIQNFSTFVNSAETCLQMFLGRFNFYAMQANAPFLGPFFFFIYVVTVAYILINMFLSILNESFSAVRQDISKQNNDYEMVDFVIRRFKVYDISTTINMQILTGFIHSDFYMYLFRPVKYVSRKESGHWRVC